MSKYTTEVRFICENAAGLDESKGFSDVDQIIADAIPSVFSFDFPVFDDAYRSVICTKILRHYYTREIGFETVGLWKLKLQTKLCEVMPYFNQLYKSELLKFNPLYDTDLATTNAANKNSETNRSDTKTGSATQTGNRVESAQGTKGGTNDTDTAEVNTDTRTNSASGSNSEAGTDAKTSAGSANSVGTESDTNYKLYSDTPQGALTGVDDEEYLTNATKTTDAKSSTNKTNSTDVSKGEYNRSTENSSADTTEGTSVGNRNTKNTYDEQTSDNRTSADSSNSSSNESSTGFDTFNSTESYVLHVVGKQSGVSYSKMLTEFRETFLNIDLEVIESLSDLFLNLW